MYPSKEKGGGATPQGEAGDKQKVPVNNGLGDNIGINNNTGTKVQTVLMDTTESKPDRHEWENLEITSGWSYIGHGEWAPPEEVTQTSYGNSTLEREPE